MLGRMRVWLAAVAGAAAAVGAGGDNTARAGIVEPGRNIGIIATTSADAGESSEVLRDELIPFTVRADGGVTLFEGTLRDRVLRIEDEDTLVFAQSVHADRGFDRPAVLDFLRRSGFAGDQTDATVAGDEGGAGPEKVFRSADGDVLHFKFDGRLAPGDFTRLASVSTAAAGFDLTGETEVAFIGQGGVEGRAHLRTARPSQSADPRPVAIPLPPAAALFPLGAAAALWARRRFLRAR